MACCGSTVGGRRATFEHMALSVDQTFTLLHPFQHLAVRWERRIELHDPFLSLACSLIRWRRLKKTGS